MYPYRFIGSRDSGEQGLFSEIADYAVDAVDLGCGNTVPYTCRSYRYDGFLYITDIFPSAWDNDPLCFKRIISREGTPVNMRRVSVTCLVLFTEQYTSRDKNAVMVVSGSYAPGEKEEGPSRKLKLYRAFFEPLIERLGLRILHSSTMNAFMLMDRRACVTDEQVENSYAEFKKRKEEQNGRQ